MGLTPEGAEKRKKTLIEKYGSEEAYREKLKEWGRKGFDIAGVGFHTMTEEQLAEARQKSLEARRRKVQ